MNDPIEIGSIVRFDPIPDEEGNHLFGMGAELAGKEWVYLGLHPDPRFADLGVARLWVPDLEGQYGFEGACTDVDVAALTVVAIPARVEVSA